MDRHYHLEIVLTFAFSAAGHPRQFPPQTLAILTAHRAATTMGATLLKIFWQDRIVLHLTK